MMPNIIKINIEVLTYLQKHGLSITFATGTTARQQLSDIIRSTL